MLKFTSYPFRPSIRQSVELVNAYNSTSNEPRKHIHARTCEDEHRRVVHALSRYRRMYNPVHVQKAARVS